MIRAAATPDRFLERGLARYLSRSQAVHPRAAARAAFALALPADLSSFLRRVGASALGDFVPKAQASNDETRDAFAAVLGAGARSPLGRAKLCALLAGCVPFGATRGGELWLYVLEVGPARGVIATLDPAVPAAPRLAFRGASSFALACALGESMRARDDAERAAELLAAIPTPGVAEQESVRASFDRALALTDLLTATDAGVRRAAKKLATRPLSPPHPPDSRRSRPSQSDRTTSLELGALVEAFFRKDTDEALDIVVVQRMSPDQLVRDAAALLADALAERPRTARARELGRRRHVAVRAARAAATVTAPSSAERALVARRIIALIDAIKPSAEPLATTEARDEALHALSEVGDRSVVPGLVARAVTGDVSAVDMLASLGDESAIAPLVSLLEREPQRYRGLEAAVARALASLGATSAAPALRGLLRGNPMPSWREGIERGVLVKELVAALGALRDEQAGPLLLAVLEATSQEYRAILPLAAWALGRIRHEAALGTLERLLSSPKEVATCEAIWAVGEIGAAHPSAAERAGRLLDQLGGNEPGAEMVRLVALAKVRAGGSDAPRVADLRRALERALWEPAFRREESSRRRTWALRSLEELAKMRGARRGGGGDDPYFLGHDAVRYFVTRDDHRIRRAAQDAFAAWAVTVPATRRYYATALDELEARDGLPALHEALRDPLGLFRHNIATRLAERAHESSVRPLAEATARLFAEPPTSTYEYDDAPSNLVAFVRALAKLNRPEGNDVLIEGLRAGNHQVRAVVAENAPEDERFVPELMAMLGDPRSFLRSRAERSLTSLGVNPRSGSDPPTRVLEV